MKVRLWAPGEGPLALHLLEPLSRRVPLPKLGPEGCFEGDIDAPVGTLYRLCVGERELPDPISRFQPFGVHGPSQFVDPEKYQWKDSSWTGPMLDGLTIYELHLGTFTSEGTFAAATQKLGYLHELGVGAVELMPVADFPGQRGWGYDGVSVGAPARCYGAPDELRAFVDTAHQLGMGVVLDFVCNHLGPDGNYLGALSPFFFSSKHQTPWGHSLNFDGENSAAVRRFFTDAARRWIDEFHFDGLRFDATHTIQDDGPRHIVAEIAATLRAEFPNRHLLFIAEDNRNLAKIVQPEAEGGWGLDAVWSDDFHHSMRRLLAGDREGYFAPFQGGGAELAEIVRRGWRQEFQKAPTLSSRVFCLQNHDQVGNRAFGERLHHQIDAAAYRAATTLLLSSPETPLLFMGQEWAATSPFLYFTDHEPGLGKKITQGRRKEFGAFTAFSSPASRNAIPDPQSESTFLNSKLRWEELGHVPHASIFRLYRALLALRRAEPALHRIGIVETRTTENAMLLIRRFSSARAIAVVVNLKGTNQVTLPTGDWTVLLSTEEPRFAADNMAPEGELSGKAPYLKFWRPGAVILRPRR